MGAAFLKADPAFNDTTMLFTIHIFSYVFYVYVCDVCVWIQFWLFAYEIYLINHKYACTHMHPHSERPKTYGIHLPLNCISKSKLDS